MFTDRFSSKFSLIVACMMVVSLLAFTPAFAGDELSKEAQASQSQPASVADAAEGAASVEAAGAAAGAAGGLMTTSSLVVGGAVLGTAAVVGVATSANSDAGEIAAEHK